LDAQIAEAKAKVSAAEAQVAEAQAKQASAEAVASRLLEASSTPGAISRLELETAEKATEAARGQVNAAIAARAAAAAAVTSLEKLRDYLRIRAPFSGVITERIAHPGALADPSGEPLLRLEQIDRLRLVAAVPEARYGAVSPGARIPFHVPAYPNETFTGRVSRIPRSLDPKTRTMAVELDIANPRARLAPGMYAEANWPVGGTSLVVPATSIATTTERVFVVRVRNNRAEWVNVKRGARQGDLVAVTGDLRAGDVILRRGTDEVRDGAAVQVR
jgi:RND family efflux transporter MFP subunit